MNENIKLTPATPSDADMLLQWRNDPETRKMSRDTGNTEPKDHMAWLSELLDNPNRKLFIAWKRISKTDISGGLGFGYNLARAIGSVRADYDPGRDIHELSWTVAPEARGRGVGKRMVKIVADQLKNIRAEIKSGNVASVKIAEHCGMEFDREDARGILHYSRREK